MILSATISVAPTTNMAYKTGKGKFYCSGEAEQFKIETAYKLREATIDEELLVKTRGMGKKASLYFEIIFYLDSTRRSDIDGRVKLTIDAVFRFLKLNDNTIDFLVVRKRLDREKPRAEVRLKHFDETH